MRFFSFRRRARLRSALMVLLVIIAVLAVLYLFSVIYSGQFIIYSRTGAYADTDWKTTMSATQERKTSDITPQVTVLPKATINTGTVRRISGCYVTTDQLSNLSALKTEIADKGYGTVVIEMKDVYGTFYYNTTISDVPVSGAVNTTEVASFIKELKASGCYLIAAIPALADQSYCLAHVDLGLPLSSGALWIDENYCYWMDPKKEGTTNYLETICLELSNLGFREVLLKDFYFPLDDTIVYSEAEGTKAEVLSNTVQKLQADVGSAITVSFGVGTALTFPSTLENGRIFVTTVHDTASMAVAASQLSACVENPEIQLVFVTPSEDEQFDKFGHIVPITIAAESAE